MTAETKQRGGMKYFDELVAIETNTRKAEALALAAMTLSNAEYRDDYVEEVSNLAADAAREANQVVLALFEAMREEKKEAGTKTGAKEVFGINGNQQDDRYAKS